MLPRFITMTEDHNGRLWAPDFLPVGRVLCLILALISFGACNPPETPSNSALPPPLRFGTRITFGQGGNSEPYKVSGWSATEEKFTWLEGTSARLRFPITATEANITLKMRIAALIKPPELPAQPVE